MVSRASILLNKCLLQMRLCVFYFYESFSQGFSPLFCIFWIHIQFLQQLLCDFVADFHFRCLIGWIWHARQLRTLSPFKDAWNFNALQTYS